MGKRAIDQKKRKANMDDGVMFFKGRPNAGWLVVVDAHSIVGQGGLAAYERQRKASAKRQYVAQMVSQV